jgi:stage II sporulation protein D
MPLSAPVTVRVKNRILLLPLFLLLTSTFARAQQEIRFGVMGLFHPQEFSLAQENNRVLSVTAQGLGGSLAHILNGEPGQRQIVFRADGNNVVAGSRSAVSWTASARDGSAVAFRLTVPGKLSRVYWGRLTIQAHKGELVAVVAMDRETAVASIVAAEMLDSAPIEALKAQAIATRSFLTAGPQHNEFDFCDTTHCQFLKSPPPPAGRVAKAVEATQGLILAYRGKPVAAMYSSRCGGQTHSLRDVGIEPADAYPYYAVPCAWCQKHLFTWKSRIGSAQAPHPSDERQRIAEARQWGWSAIPGSDFTATEEGKGWQLQGHSLGHGVGMCQYGAIGMAESGASFREILSHYYPNTSLVSQP